jgi:HAD superfamily hydrolase (TIGR01549 family)
MEFNPYLFDLDNSLLYIPDPPQYFDNILVETLKSFWIKEIPSREERNKFWNSGEHYIDFLHKWGIKLKEGELFWRRFDAKDFEKRKILIGNNKIKLFPDAIDVLDKLKAAGKKLALVTNTAKYIVDYIVKKFQLHNYFDDIFALGYGKEQEIAKPSPEGINLVLKNIGFYPKKSYAIMIGDSKLDIIAAKRANITACLLKRNLWKFSEAVESWEYQPDFIVENLKEIFTL